MLRAVRTGNADDGNAAVVGGAAMVRRLGGRWKEVVADRLPDRAGRAFGGLEVHQQSGPGVDLDNRTALRLERP